MLLFLVQLGSVLGYAHNIPGTAIKLLSALGRELSVRIRHANMTILQLES